MALMVVQHKVYGQRVDRAAPPAAHATREEAELARWTAKRDEALADKEAMKAELMEETKQWNKWRRGLWKAWEVPAYAKAGAKVAALDEMVQQALADVRGSLSVSDIGSGAGLPGEGPARRRPASAGVGGRPPPPPGTWSPNGQQAIGALTQRERELLNHGRARAGGRRRARARPASAGPRAAGRAGGADGRAVQAMASVLELDSAAVVGLELTGQPAARGKLTIGATPPFCRNSSSGRCTRSESREGQRGQQQQHCDARADG